MFACSEEKHSCFAFTYDRVGINCSDSDTGDVAFVKSTGFIRGWDVVEEYVACRLYPLLASVSFREVVDGVAPASKLKLSLPKFHIVRSDEEVDIKFLARVELEAENVVSNYSRPDHEGCVKFLPNGGRLN
jgi:hypothetical protein